MRAANDAQQVRAASSRRSTIVALDPPYEVRIGPGVLDEVAPAAAALGREGRVFVIADERVFALHGTRLGALADAPRALVPGGEATKRLARVEEMLDALAAAELDRASLVIAFGGGAVGDAAGLAAALYMRGIALLQCPTTLLAQVDASVGGKTAVNLQAGKNLAGAFHQPRAVFADTSVLATLDPADLRSGLGELFKTALVEGELALTRLEERAEQLVLRDPLALADAVADAVATKARIVALDPLEAGPRRTLNLGHTFAHAIERALGYGHLPHGVAVAVGCGLALRASEACGRLADPGLPARARALAARLGLPFDLREVVGAGRARARPELLAAAMATDKKGSRGRARFVLIERPGQLALGVELDDALVERVLGDSLRG